MFYVKLAEDGTVDQYPYTLTDLKKDMVNTSFPDQVSDECAASFNCYLVTPTDPPADAHTVNLKRTAIKQHNGWVEQWISTPATPEQIAERTAAKADDVRSDRNKRLANCDWTQLPDAPVNETAWATYRQALRDITNQKDFPWSVQWPSQPS